MYFKEKMKGKEKDKRTKVSTQNRLFEKGKYNTSLESRAQYFFLFGASTLHSD